MNKKAHYLFFITLIFALCYSFFTLAGHPYVNAKKFLAQKKYQKAENEFKLAKKREPVLNDYIDYYLAYISFYQHKYQKAKKEFTTFLYNYKNSVLTDKADYYRLLSHYKVAGKTKMTTQDLMDLAVASWKNRQYDFAGHIWQWLLQTKPNTPEKEDIIRWLARYDYRKGRYKKGKKRLNYLVNLKGKQATSALYVLGKYDELLQEYPESTLADDILFKRGLKAYFKKQYKKAESNFQKIVSNHPDANYRPDALYWLAKLKEKLGSQKEAEKYLGQIYDNHPYDYWGYKAAQKLKLKPAILPIYPVPIKYTRLMQIESFEDAGLEIHGRFKKDKKNTFFILPFWDKISWHSKQNNVDPYLVSAIIREESRFNTKAVSSSGAIGLMQIMPKTGKHIAQKYKIKNYSQKRLFDPYFNIQLGIKYVSEVKKKYFPDSIINILASYNAGPTAMFKWNKKYGHIKDEDEFIEKIPYKETRRYVKKVLRSYWIYKNSATKFQ